MTKYTITDIIKSLADRPKLTASELKAKFDKANTDIGNFINNTLIPEVEAALSGKSDSSHTHEKTEVGLGNVDNTPDIDKPVSNAVQSALDLKVDKADGKELSDNNYTDDEKSNVSYNTAARHTHLNKDVIDGINEYKLSVWDTAAEELKLKANKDSLSAVATSGSYNDLTDIPIINLDIANESELDNLNHEELSLGAGDCVFYKGKYFGNPYLLLVQVVYGPGETEWPDTIIDDGVRTFQFMWASNYPHANIKACYKSRVYKHDYSTDEGVWSAWSEYLTSDDVVDDLASSESKKALSAKQGKILNGKISTIETNIGYMDSDINDILSRVNECLTYNEVIDNVSSTDTNKPLSANQGKILSDKIGDIETALDNIIAIQNTLIGGESV